MLTKAVAHISIAHRVQNRVQPAGVVDCLSEEHNGLPITTIRGVLGFQVFSFDTLLIRLARRENEDEGMNRSWEKGKELQVIHRNHIVKTERRGDAELVYKLGENIGIRFKGDEMLAVSWSFV